MLQKMHEEDNALGLKVSNRKGETWKAYGDKRLFEPENSDNCSRFHNALQASADEVFECYRLRKIVQENPGEYAVWYHTPVPNSWENFKENHSPLFTESLRIRKDISRPDCYEHEEISDWTWLGTYKRLSDCPTFAQY